MQNPKRRNSFPSIIITVGLDFARVMAAFFLSRTCFRRDYFCRPLYCTTVRAVTINFHESLIKTPGGGEGSRELLLLLLHCTPPPRSLAFHPFFFFFLVKPWRERDDEMQLDMY